MERAIHDSYRSYISFHTCMRVFQLYVELGVMVLSFLNVVVIISLGDNIDPNIAGLSISLSSGLLGLTAFWSKSMV